MTNLTDLDVVALIFSFFWLLFTRRWNITLALHDILEVEKNG